MTKRIGLFDISVDVKKLFQGEQITKENQKTIDKALAIITKQMQVNGFRERTI